MPSISQLIFGTKAPTPAVAAPAPGQPRQVMPVVNPGANPDNQNHPAGTSANGPAVDSIPLDEFKDLWKAPATDPKAVDPFSAPTLSMDPAKLQEAVGKMNFMEGVSQEVMAKAMQDPTVFAQVVNTAAQKAFAAAATLSTQAIEGSHQTNNKRIQDSLPKRIKEHTVSEIRSDNPILNHSATAPMLDMAKRAIMGSNPDYTPSQVQAAAERYITEFGAALNGQKEQKQNTGPDPFDFSDLN